MQVYEPDPDNANHFTTIPQDPLRVAEHLDAMRLVADQGEGAHQAEVLSRELGGRFVPFRFTAASRDFLVDNACFLVEKELLELPIEPDEVHRAFLNVQATEDGYKHPSRKLKDLFDAMELAVSEVRSEGGGQSMDLLASRRRDRGAIGPGRAGRPHGLRYEV